MFKIYKFSYFDKEVQLGWVFYARTEPFADMLADRIARMGYKPRRKRIGFKKQVFTEIPPYELEQSQIEYVENMENNYKVVNG